MIQYTTQTCGCVFHIDEKSRFTIHEKCQRHSHLADEDVYPHYYREQLRLSGATQFILNRVPESRKVYENNEWQLTDKEGNPVTHLPFSVDSNGVVTINASTMLLPEEIDASLNEHIDDLFGGKVIIT